MFQYDEVITKADEIVKEVFVLRHYYTVALARFKDTCNKSGLITEADDSLEACIMGMKRGTKEGSVLQVCIDHTAIQICHGLANNGLNASSTPWMSLHNYGSI